MQVGETSSSGLFNGAMMKLKTLDREKDNATLCPKTTLLKGLAIHGSLVSVAKKDVTNWLSKIGMIS